MIRQCVDLDAALHVPHQQARVEVVAADLVAHPPLAPGAERHDDRPQLLAGRGQVVLRSAPVGGTAALDDAGDLEVAQPLDEQTPRDQRHPAMQVVEAVAAAEQLADHERSPAFRDDLGCLGHGAELAIAGHDLNLDRPSPGVKF